MTDTLEQSEQSNSCPNCGNTVTHLVHIEAGLKLRLQEQGIQAPSVVCEACVQQFSKSVSKGARLRAEAQAREHNRLNLWRNRVNLIKQARQLMAQKNFSEAAVAYEKYLRVLEIVYNKEPGEISPDLFSNEARRSEITVITSVYWDLMRIYDTSTRYGERQIKAAEKLAQFVRFTPVFPSIVRRAEQQTRSARNPAAFRHFLKHSNQNRPRCFVATSAFNGYQNSTVESLCLFRDAYLKQRRWGRWFVFAYYKFSPTLAEALDATPALKPFVRKLLRSLATQLVDKFDLKHRAEL